MPTVNQPISRAVARWIDALAVRYGVSRDAVLRLLLSASLYDAIAVLERVSRPRMSDLVIFDTEVK